MNLRLTRAIRLAAMSVGALLAGAIGLVGPTVAEAAAHYQFQTYNDNNDTTFNQLLGINNSGVIAGYFGSGAQGHPNMGYLVFPKYYQNYYLDENVPNSMQTQVTAINDGGINVGFWSDTNDNDAAKNANFGFYRLHGKFHTVNFPTSDNSNPAVNQLLGVNDSNVAVGFYNDSAGNSHGYLYSINNHHFRALNVPSNVTSDTAAAINNRGDIAGFATIGGNTEAFLLRGGQFMPLSVSGAAMTQAFGVNDRDEVVGVYTVGTGNNAQMHGFTWTPGHGFTTVDDPNGIGATTINGVSDRGQLVGFYTDGAGNTDGMLATPRH